MTARLFLGAALITLSGCAPSHQPLDADSYPKAKFWEAFALHKGKSAVFPDGLVVTFEEVLTPPLEDRDSGEARPVAASVLLSLWTAEGVADSLTLYADPMTPGRGRCMGYEVELRRLLAEAPDGEDVAKDDYWASLVIGKY